MAPCSWSPASPTAQPKPGIVSTTPAPCVPLGLPVQLQDGTSENWPDTDPTQRAHRWWGRWGRAGESRVHPQEKGQEPHDEYRLCLVSLAPPLFLHICYPSEAQSMSAPWFLGIDLWLWCKPSSVGCPWFSSQCNMMGIWEKTGHFSLIRDYDAATFCKSEWLTQCDSDGLKQILLFRHLFI